MQCDGLKFFNWNFVTLNNSKRYILFQKGENYGDYEIQFLEYSRKFGYILIVLKVCHTSQSCFPWNNFTDIKR